ncbi:MAG: DUF2931 family protein [Pseudomonas sp.]|jgi:hypothetical protein|uniref:DUF2931 family protein n=1 Tax=Pseudomonas sp. TaxID=306 RepID=UPI002385984C|nr:DUF2931 family protein [Pseudomonas sp.]MDE1194765.1 DUF2931 family protein [Pseudomonas sp.]
MKRLILLVGLLISLGACATGPSPVVPPKLPFPAWYIGFVAPKHMEVWVESVDVLDQRGFGYFNVHGGVAGYTGEVEGWPKQAGGGKPINNVDLPDRIYLRWQSLVEPQAYTIGIQIPQWVRDEMVKPQRVFCQGAKKWKKDYRDMISLGMAPGGVVKVWVGGACLKDKEVGRFQAKVHPLGPFQNRKGLYYRDPSPEAQAWIEKNGIPYGSW